MQIPLMQSPGDHIVKCVACNQELLLEAGMQLLIEYASLWPINILDSSFNYRILPQVATSH